MKVAFTKTPSRDLKCLICRTQLHNEGLDTSNLTDCFNYTLPVNDTLLLLIVMPGVHLRGKESKNILVKPGQSHQLMWRVKESGAVDQSRLKEVNVVCP